jgi:hypothetical protein
MHVSLSAGQTNAGLAVSIPQHFRFGSRIFECCRIRTASLSKSHGEETKRLVPQEWQREGEKEKEKWQREEKEEVVEEVEEGPEGQEVQFQEQEQQLQQRQQVHSEKRQKKKERKRHKLQLVFGRR